MTHYNVSFAGAGRLAVSLCRNLYGSGNRILRIVSGSEGEGRMLAQECGAEWSAELVYDQPADIIIVAVPDQKLEEVLTGIKCSEKTIIAHTAGSYGLDVFPERIKKKGVFYPLQTFSHGRNVSFKDLPVIIEASRPGVRTMLKRLAESVGARTFFIDHKNRRMLHLAAVFVCNYVNFMLTAGKEVTTKAGLSFNLLEPLITETVSKALDKGPEYSQTGPAVRNDIGTIKKHLELLSFSPELQKIYNEISEAIIDYHNRSI